MARFRYKAVNAAGELVQGEMDATTENAAIGQLQSIGLLPIRADPAKGTGLKELLALEIVPTRRGLSRRELAMITREIATLLDAGIELEKALDILRSLTEREQVDRVLSQILEDVRGGSTLADGLAKHPDSFSKLYVSMVRGAEAGGALEPVFMRMAEFLERSETVKEEVKSALIYPIVLLSTAVLSVVVLVGFVLPRFRPLFESAGQELPMATQMVMFAGEAVEANWWLILVLALISFLALRYSLQRPSARLRLDAGLLRAPVIGELLTRIETARLTRTLGTLLGNGVPMISALDIAQETVGNRAYVDGLAGVTDAVKSGRRLSEELEATNVFPRLGGHLVRVGEESGQLEGMLLKTADIYDQEARRSIQRALAILTPMLTILLGFFIAGIIFSLLIAILSINEIAF